MTYRQAVKLLDALKDGADYPMRLIMMALRLTGDVERR